MSLYESTQNSVSAFLNRNANNIRLRYFISSYSGNDYDNQYTTVSGANIWVKGYQQRLGAGDNQQLTEAGAISYADSKLHIIGSLATEPDVWTKFGIGSPVQAEYVMMENGMYIKSIGSSAVYREIFCRKLNLGSFAGEV